MSATSAAAAAESTAGATSVAGLLESMREASLLCADRSADEDRSRRERHAVLAVAEVASKACGLAVKAHRGVPRAAVAAAGEVLGARGGLERNAVATTLAEMFEQAVGANGRRNEGVVYTPTDVVRFMVREGIAARLSFELGVDPDDARVVAAGGVDMLGDQERRRVGRLLGRMRVVDPAAGAGAFLVAAAVEISRLAGILRECGALASSRLATPRAALESCCHGFEVDPDATYMAGIVLALSCYGPNADAVPQVVTTRNALLGGLSHSTAPNGWDLVLMNPPYVGGKHLRERLGGEFQAELRTRDGFSGDLLSHFLMRALEGIRRGGALSAIVSDTAFTMGSAAPVRAALLEQTALFSLAWCRPFAAAAQGGIVSAVKGGRVAQGEQVRCFAVERGGDLSRVRGRKARLDAYYRVPGQPFFRPSSAAASVSHAWQKVDDLDRLWRRVGGRGRGELHAAASAMEAGEWTLLGTAVLAGQGLATGDDRRFVGFLAGTDAARAALQRQHRILDELREDPARAGEWRRLKRLLGSGMQLGEALVCLLDRDVKADLPGRKPFRIVGREQYRCKPLSEDELRRGIADGPAWIPYETSDRSGCAGGGARWARENPVAVDWSADAVALLRRRRANGPKRPVMRHEELWFKGGVTHNRVSSYLRARSMPVQAIFSSESPCYVPAAPWLSELSLLALLNAPVVEFILKTFLATRNHIELGHVLRIPVPVPTKEQRHSLESLARGAVDSVRLGKSPLEAERELDALTRDLYGLRKTAALTIAR